MFTKRILGQPVHFASVLTCVLVVVLMLMATALCFSGRKAEIAVEATLSVRAEKVRNEQSAILANIYYTSRNILGNVMYDSEINEILKNTTGVNPQAIRTIRNKLRMAQTIHINDIDYRVVLLDLNGNMYANWLRGAGYYEDIFEQPVVQSALEERKSFFLVKHPFWYLDDENPIASALTVSFGSIVMDQYLPKPVGVMLFSVEEESLLNALEHDGQVAVTNAATGERICGSVEDELYAYIQENSLRFPMGETVRESWNGRQVLICRSMIATSGIELLQVMAFDEVYRELIALRKLNLMLMLVGLSLIAAVMGLIMVGMTRPLHQLYHQICALNIDQDGAIPRITSRGYRECSEVADAVNDMSKRTMDMIKVIERQQRERAELKYRYLLSQLDPHFLLNTLNNIKWAAYMDNAPRVAEQVMALGFLLEASLGKNGEQGTIDHEINHVKSYMLLQSMHYGTDVDCRIEAEESVGDRPCEPYTLMTLVGNAIKHGYTKGRMLDITVRIGQKEGRLNICVSDNGRGMTPERLQQVKRELQESESGERSSHIGLRNLNQRLVYRYGGQAELDLDSKEGKGTSVWLSVPVEWLGDGGIRANV